MTERGRPRSFDRAAALRRAMELFWRRGYDGASTGELCKAMGIAKPSLYAAFGCKEELFREAVRLYDTLEGAPIQCALEAAPTARAGVEATLRLNARAYTDADKPPGCMIVLSALIGPPENEAVRRFLGGVRREGEAALRDRIMRGMAEGDVPPEADAARLAAFYTAVTQGLSVQARDGASMDSLSAIVDCAMAAWDTLTNRA